MRNFANIDILSVNCVNPQQSIQALKYCSKFFKFKDIILFTDSPISDPDITIKTIPKLDWHSYNDFILKLGDYTDADYVLVIQDDGHIVNPDMWTDEFLNYDYIGAPWPAEESWISLQMAHQQEYMRKVFPKNRVGNGGFSLRSKKFLEFSAQYMTCDNLGEDSFLCTRVYDEAIEYGIKFAPLKLATQFSYENPCIENGTPWDSKISFDKTKHFGWHGKNFINTHELLSLKYT
jgi:hypothetical protein